MEEFKEDKVDSIIRCWVCFCSLSWYYCLLSGQGRMFDIGFRLKQTLVGNLVQPLLERPPSNLTFPAIKVDSDEPACPKDCSYC